MNIELYIEKKDGTKYNITNIITDSVTTSGDLKSVGRKLEFSTMTKDNFNIEGGDLAKFYDNGDEVFRGKVLSITKNSSGNSFKYIALDEGWRLSKSKGSYNFKQKTADEIASEVLQKNKFVRGNIIKGKTKMDKLFVNKSFYDIIMTAYTEESKVSDKKYMMVITRQKVHIIEKGITVLRVGFEEGKNITESDYSINAEGIINRVVITDKDGNSTDVKDKKDLQEVYGVIQEVKKMKDDNGMSNDDINDMFKDVDKKCSLKGIVTDSSVVTGNAVMVKDSISGLTGKFYIDGDTHTYQNGVHEVSLTLNFENIMDEKSEDGDEEAVSEGSFGTGELIGRKVKANFSAYHPDGSAMEGGSTTSSGEKIDFNKRTCAVPTRSLFQHNIQVIGTGTKWDGVVFRGNDTGGAIDINGDVYDFDLLMPTKSDMDKFGRHKGNGVYAIIGPPGTPKFKQSAAGGKAGRVVAEVKRHLGKPYRWGATGPSSFDCSGLVQYCYKKIGINIPRTSREQSGFGKKVGEPYAPGDLLFFGSPVHHVAMYIGNNEYIHAPQTGDVVKVTKCGRHVTVARRIL